LKTLYNKIRGESNFIAFSVSQARWCGGEGKEKELFRSGETRSGKLVKM